MQRRAAAVYFALLVLIAGGAYAFLQVGMAPPTAEFDADTYGQGDEFSVGGTTYSVAGVDASESEGGEMEYEGELTWTNQTGAEQSTTFGQGENVTLGDVQHVVHFPSGSEVYILPHDQYFDAYQEFTDTQDHFSERKAGFWGIIYISLIGGIVLLMSAFMPVKG